MNFGYLGTIVSQEEFSHKLNENKKYLDEAKDNLKVRQGELTQTKPSVYNKDLGWLNIEEWASEADVAHIVELAQKVKKEADVFIIVGVGGSNQAARAVIEALQVKEDVEVLYLGNNISPHYVNKVLSELEGKSVYMNVIAKNFETLEPGIGFRILRDYLQERYGNESHKRIFVTGTKNSYLHELSNEHEYTFLSFPDNIGGRYSAISNVGLFPMAVSGVDIRSLIEGAKEMQKRLESESHTKNIALMYSTYRNILLEKGYAIEMLGSFEPQFDYFAKWWIQLFAESEGKDDKGIFPVSASYSEDLHSIGQYVQDGKKIIFETFIDVDKPNSSYVLSKDKVDDRFDYLDEKDLWDVNKDVYNATIKSHSEGGIPCATLTIPEINEYYFGQLFYYFMFSCYLSGRILEIDPFNQPGVEKYKVLMFDKLGKNK